MAENITTQLNDASDLLSQAQTPEQQKVLRKRLDQLEDEGARILSRNVGKLAVKDGKVVDTETTPLFNHRGDQVVSGEKTGIMESTTEGREN